MTNSFALIATVPMLLSHCPRKNKGPCGDWRQTPAIRRLQDSY